MTTKTIDPVEQLTRLEAARDAARAAEEQARDAHARLLAAIPAARAALTQAVAAGDGVKAAEEAFAAAQRAASDPALAPRAEGLAARTRSADAAVRSHTNQNLAALIEDLRPRAEAAVTQIRARAADLRVALGEYNQVGSEISRRSAYVQWFSSWERTPRAPLVDELTTSLDACRLDDEQQLPAPMPSSTLRPVEEAQRLRLAAEMAA